MKLTRKVVLTAAAIVTAGSLASCSGTAAPTRSAIDEFPDTWENEITIDVFDGLANYMGVQQGWFAKIVKDSST